MKSFDIIYFEYLLLPIFVLRSRSLILEQIFLAQMM